MIGKDELINLCISHMTSLYYGDPFNMMDCLKLYNKNELLYLQMAFRVEGSHTNANFVSMAIDKLPKNNNPWGA